MKKLLGEPVLHFLLLGAALFAVAQWREQHAPSVTSEATRVRLTQQDVEWLQHLWTRQWQRPPTTGELRAVTAAYLREELMCREARELGLDQNDTFVRRWLAQKIEFLVLDDARLPEPAEDDLKQLHQAQRERFAIPAQITFTQDFDPLPREMTGDQAEVTKVFGTEFARQLFALADDSATIVSGYGQHNVRVLARVPVRQPEFAEVRARVLAAWREEQSRQQRQQYFAGLLRKYDITVDESVRPVLGPVEEVLR